MSLTEERARPAVGATTPADATPGARSRWWPELLYLAVFYLIYRLTPDRGTVDVPRARPRPPAAKPAFVSAAARGLRWWKEAIYILAFYLIYSAVRNTQGSAAVSASHAMGHALEIIRLEKALGLYHEEAIQHAFLGHRLFIEFWNLFYGSFHFVVTTFALILLFRRFPERYRPWRNTLAFTTALALIGFATYPLMPPRLLPPSYRFVDTLKSYGALWSFDSGAVNKISNQYAAMPSLHFAWSTWSALVLIPAVRSVWAKVLAGVYPFLTLFAIVVTANHFILDAAGGAVVLLAGLTIGFPLARWMERRVAGRAATAAASAATAPVPVAA